MKFLVILICVVASLLWKHELDRIKDDWFYYLRGRIEAVFKPLEDSFLSAWMLVYFFTFAVPLLVLALVLWATEGMLFGIITMLVHIFVLLMAFDRTQPGTLVLQYRQQRESADPEAGREFLRQELACTSLSDSPDINQLDDFFSRLFVYRCFEKMFVMFFWYLVAGPLGVMVAYVCYQLRDGVFTRLAVEAQISERNQADAVAAFIGFLEWLPVRLLGMTLSLVGNFESCFSRLRNTGWISYVATEQTVYEYAVLAISPRNEDGSAADSGEQGNVPGGSGQSRSAGDWEAQIAALQALMVRSQIIWLVVIALITVFGGDF